MPPLLAAFLGSFLRHFLVAASVYFVTHGYFTQTEAMNYIAGFITFALGFGWSLWQKYANHASFSALLARLDALQLVRGGQNVPKA